MSNAIKSGSVVEIQRIKHSLNKVENELADICAMKNKVEIEKHVNGISNEEGEFNVPRMWKIKNKVIKKNSDKPTAKKDSHGNLVTSHGLLKKLYENTYLERLKHREISPELSNLKEMKEDLFDLRLMTARNKKSPPFTKENLTKVLKSLKCNKAREQCVII